jgi:basic membrane protein A
MTSRPPRFRALVAAFAWTALCLTVAGCGKQGGDEGKPALRLGMVTDTAGLGDKSFNDSANAGLDAAKAQLHADVSVLESKSAADYQPNLTFLANQDFDEIYAVGFLMSKDVERVARAFPKKHFALIDAAAEEPNVSAVVFREQEGAFLAGALAAMVSKSRTIGFLGGMDVPLLRRFEAGYAAGARQIDPRVKVLVKYAGSFDDVPAGKELASVLYDQHADVLFVAAGKTGLGAIDETRARPNVYAIGVDSDQDALAKGKILTSVLKRVDVAVFELAEEVIAQKIPSGTQELGLREGGIALTPFTYSRAVVKPAMIARLHALRNAIVAGTIVPPRTREELAAFKPAAR